ncbi:PPOX class F420-dependent oxidoreductase [Kribbella pittospori]|uniref:PPOX class F420-dependent oxidoreductase n=1 Tax=Kribbella pittospori TaxID=722689 RepID=A0A4R0KDN1_9ACTN|nr:PPOX class F420-dependent oxidoreductase [Kribbella pittospori]TCC57587.1 PPOX class F420-dependent oxidoreductase [Kribbella pittospori]
MELNEIAQALIDGDNPAVLATTNADGSPQTSVVWVGRDGDDVLISTGQGRKKDRNVRRDPRVSVIVIDKDEPLRYVEIRGTAAVSADVDRELAQRLAEKYQGEGAGKAFADLPPEMIRIVIRITAEKVHVRN